MNCSKLTLFFLSLAVLLTANVLLASDILELKDGTVIKGTLISRDAVTIKFRTQYAEGAYPVAVVKNLTMGGFGPPSPEAPAAPLAPPATAAPAVKKAIKAGAVMSVKLTQPLSSKMKKGSRVGGQLTAPISAGGTVIAAGTRVYGTVTSASVGRTCHVAVSITQLLALGQPVDIRTQEVRFSGSGNIGVGRAAARGAAAGAIIKSSGSSRKGARKGAKWGAGAAILSGPQSTEVPAGTVFDATVLRNVTIP